MASNALRNRAVGLICLLCVAAGCGADETPERREGAATSGRSGGARAGAGANPVQPSIPSALAGAGAAQPPGPAAPSGSSDICASAVVQTARNMPTIMFVVDGSGSMCASYGGSTRWQALRSALLDPMRGLIYRLQSSVSFGVTLYDGSIDLVLALSSTTQAGAAQNPSCASGGDDDDDDDEGGSFMVPASGNSCPQLIEVLPPRTNNAAAIDMAYPRQQLGGSTPTDKAMTHVMDRLLAMVQQQGPDQKAQSPVYVILATDGAPNDICVGGAGGDGSAQRQGVIAAVDRGAAAGITTWVVSLAGGDAMLQAHLDEVARHGDPKNPTARTFSPMNPEDLLRTLGQLLGGAVGCHISLNGKVTRGLECSGMVQHNGIVLPCCEQSAAGWQCNQQPSNTPNGWRLSDESSIELVGDACTNFLIGQDSSLMATFPCEVFRPQ